jgi:hypothetical protein
MFGRGGMLFMASGCPKCPSQHLSGDKIKTSAAAVCVKMIFETIVF